ncbi:SPOR domain-containing protein [Thalassospira povalilytica]|uniref:SPOR domain-containing protein n=1 Tax=Thalassospira povalilytica TaxID=732237 RepID=UPI001D191144|nr:SPOR domain-containing protein [Thalassospira povalilytica]MCC4241370.1 SPOR domain-containing protein [Thalassospira povalilytica]
MKKILVVAAPLALGACGGPIELTVAKLAGDLISYVTTGKSTTDHAVSIVAAQDCALHRPLFDQDVCKDEETILEEEAAALAVMGEPEIKREIRAARPEIYAVNAPAENWSRPADMTATPIIKTDLPPRASVSEAALDAPVAPVYEVATNDGLTDTQPVEVASASEQLDLGDVNSYGREGNVLDPQAEADAAIAGYVPDAKPAEPALSGTVTAALVDTTVMTDDGTTVSAPIDVTKDGQGLAGDVLAAPLPGDYVILASFTDKLRAQKALEIYHEYQPRLLNALVSGRTYMRVAVGPLSAEHANDLRLLAAKKGVKDPWIVGIGATGE